MSHEKTPMHRRQSRRRQYVELGFDFTDVAEEHERAARSRGVGKGQGVRDESEMPARESVHLDQSPFLDPTKI